MHKRTLDLGKKLVEELDIGDRYDTLSRWMAHYIAEQISLIEDSKGDISEYKEKCFDAILKLWEHRSVIQYEHRPFKNFESIFRALERLDPENQNTYFSNSVYEQTNESTTSDLSVDTKKWLDTALTIDRTTRVWIEHSIKQAATCVLDDKTKMWLENSVETNFNDDIDAIIRIIRDLDTKDKETEEEIKQKKIEAIKDRKRILELFLEHSRELLNCFDEELVQIMSDHKE